MVDYHIHIFCDNKSSIHLAESPTFHTQTKHIEVHYHFVLEKVLKGEIDLKYDKFITKSLTNKKLIEFCDKMGMVEACVEREY